MDTLTSGLADGGTAFPPAERPAVTVDVLVFTVVEDALRLALVKRLLDPFKGRWALPGGFVLKGESLEDAALREVREEAGVSGVYLEQLYTFGAPHRDPRRRVITVAYYALTPADRIHLRPDTDATAASWFAVSELPPLAFDHAAIVRTGVERLRGKLDYSDIAFRLLPEQFRLSDAQRVYEAILGEPLDKRNFRKHLLSRDLVAPTDAVDAGGAHRPARLYRATGRQRDVWSDAGQGTIL